MDGFFIIFFFFFFLSRRKFGRSWWKIGVTRFGRKERRISRDVPFLERIKKGSALFASFQSERIFLRRSRPLEYYPLKRRIKIWKCAFTRENNRGNDNGPENPERNARADGGCITSSRTTVNDIWQTFRERIRFNAEFDLHIFPFILDFILSRFV